MKFHGDLSYSEGVYTTALIYILQQYEVNLDRIVVRIEVDPGGEGTGRYLQFWYMDEILLFSLKAEARRPFVLLDKDYKDLVRELRHFEVYPGPVYEEPNTRVYLTQPNDLSLLSDQLFDSIDEVLS